MSASYQVEHRQGASEIRGVLRLESVSAYAPVFEKAHDALAQHGASYTLDLRAVTLMNSSGVRALANLVLRAKQQQATLVVIGSESVTWQRKTMVSLGMLYEGLEIQLR